MHFAVDGIEAGNVTRGHRFLAPAPIKVRRFDDYDAEARDGQGRARSASARKEIILADAKNLAFAQGLELVEDEALLDEVAGPGRMAGGADRRLRRAFPAIPPEVIRATIRANQKCFVRRATRKTAQLANRFILVANIEATRRRQGDRRRQRARDPRAAVGCEFF